MMTATRIDRGSNETTTIYSDGGDLVFERTFNATREQVWKAFMDPERLPRWWGPHGTTTTVAEMDVRPGGKWRYISHAADRDDVTFYGEYLEIDPPASFKWTSCSMSRVSAPRAARRPSPSRKSAARRRSRPSRTSDRWRPLKAPSPAAWSVAQSRPGIAWRPCWPKADHPRWAGHPTGGVPGFFVRPYGTNRTADASTIWSPAGGDSA